MASSTAARNTIADLSGFADHQDCGRTAGYGWVYLLKGSLARSDTRVYALVVMMGAF